MSNEWTSARIDYVRHSQPSQREWHEALDEIERLQARVAELEAAAPKPGDVVLVSRELVAEMMVFDGVDAYKLYDELQSCLDAPAVRVAGPGDVVIPAVVVGSLNAPDGLSGFELNHLTDNSGGEWRAGFSSIMDIGKRRDGDSPQAAVDALAAALPVRAEQK